MRESFDVIIVGAGLAGLQSANYLVEKGLSVCVLEAKDRVGGRTETVQVHGNTFDLGAQWVAPDELQPRLNALIKEFKLETNLQHTQGRGILKFGGKVTEYSGEVSEVAGFPLYNDMIEELDQMAQKVPLDMPWNAPTSEEFKYSTPAAWLQERCNTAEHNNTREVFEGSIRCLFTSEAHEIDWLFFLFTMKSGVNYSIHSDTHGAAQHQTVIGGTQQISEKLLEKLKKFHAVVYVKSHVFAIDQTGEGVKVFFKNDNKAKIFHSRYVIMTAPPPMAGRISYFPPLPPLRDALTSHMRMGIVIKCFITYEKPFWREKGLSGEIFTDTGPICNYYDASPPSLEIGTLIGFIAGKHGVKYAHCTEEERKQAILAQLESILGPQAKDATGYVEKNWLNDETSRGGYLALMTPTDMRTMGSMLRENCGKIVWAGTETSTKWYGYMEGALESAERASNSILQMLNSSAL